MNGLFDLMNPCKRGVTFPSALGITINVNDPNIDPETGQKRVPCFTLTIPIIVAASADSNSDKKAACSFHTDKHDFLGLCDFNGQGTFVERFACTGDWSCCDDFEEDWVKRCKQKGKYGQYTDVGPIKGYIYQADCCKR